MPTTPPDPDDPVLAVAGKYAWVNATSDELLSEDREFDIARSDTEAK